MELCRAGILLVLLSLIPLTAGCRAAHPFFQADDAVSIPCSGRKAYFPDFRSGQPGLFGGDDQADWETHTLLRMQEPSLYSCSESKGLATLRFLWDRSLSPPIAARLTIGPSGKGTLVVSMLAHNGLIPPPLRGEKPETEASFYRRTIAKEVPVTSDQVKHALSLLNRVRFVTDERVPDTTDGSDWIFETEEAGKYRLVDFRNRPAPAAKELGLYLVQDLGRISVPEGEIY